MKKKIILLIVLMLSCLAIITFFSKLNRNNDISTYLQTDNFGYYYEKDIIDLSESKPNFYATLHTNRLKSILTEKIENADMASMKEYNLHDFVCILQLIKNNYSFSLDEKRDIEKYLQSLQDEKRNWLVVVNNDENALNLENLLYYTAEAVEISRNPDIKLKNIEKIKEFIRKTELVENSSKIVMSLVKIDKILKIGAFSDSEIFSVYKIINQNWIESTKAGLEWTFDIYYMSLLVVAVLVYLY